MPFDAAQFNKRMGAGPLHIIDNGLLEKIKAAGNEVVYTQIVSGENFQTELSKSFELFTRIKEEVKKAIECHYLPIVLSGNCSATVGVIAGLNATGLGVIWFDAHGDCETPESTTSGFLDGMGISMLLNSCWQNLLSVHNLTSPLRGKNIVLVGVRDLSKHEEMFLKTNGVHRIMVDEIKRSSAGSIKAIYDKLVASGVHKIHLHVDVDVIDPVVAPSNSYAIADGLVKNELIEIVKACIGKMPLTSVTIASYDPSLDTNGHMRQLINELIEVIVEYTKV